MKQWSKASASAGAPGAPTAGSWSDEDLSPAQRGKQDLTLAHAYDANVLLIGDDPELSSAAASFAASAGSAAVTLWPGTVLPHPPQAHLLVVARRVDKLRRAEQHQMLLWLDHAGRRPRVISTASPALWPMVRDGAFSPELYYRLNTVCVRLSRQSPADQFRIAPD